MGQTISNMLLPIAWGGIIYFILEGSGQMTRIVVAYHRLIYRLDPTWTVMWFYLVGITAWLTLCIDQS